MGLTNILRGLLHPGDPYTLTEYRLPGRGRLPTGWSRDYVHIKVDRTTGPEVFNATRSSSGDIYIRPGRAHISSARNRTRAARAHVHLTPKRLLRDDSNLTAARLGVKHAGRMGVPRTRLSDRALQRELRAGVDQVQRTIGTITDTQRLHGFGKQVTATFNRQAKDLRSLTLTTKQLRDITSEMRAEAYKGRRGLSSQAQTAQTAWRLAARSAERLAKEAATANETAIKAAAKAAEASTRAAAAAAEAQAKAAVAAAEEASKAAAKAAEEAAKRSMQVAEGVARTAAAASEAAIKTAAAAAEVTAKATAATAEATIKAAAYTVAAAATAVASAFDS